PDPDPAGRPAAGLRDRRPPPPLLPLRGPGPREEGRMTAAACEYTDVLLKVEGVSVTRGGVPILRDLDLEVRDLRRPGFTQGQVVGLLGPSGIGKTTLFRILAGLDRPDTGTVLLGTECVPVERGMVGVVAQQYPLFAHRTVLANMMVAGGRACPSGAALRQKAEELLQR